jgi:hypothetical protein
MLMRLSTHHAWCLQHLLGYGCMLLHPYADSIVVRAQFMSWTMLYGARCLVRY